MTILQEDTGLRDAFKRGERAALAQVYRFYARPLSSFLAKGFAFNSAGRQLFFPGFTDAGDVEATVQEVFIRAFGQAAREGYDGCRPFRNYLFAIAKNIVLDRLRLASSSLVRVDLDAALKDGAQPAAVGDAPPDPEAHLLDREVQRVVDEFVASLSEAERPFFEARFLRHLSVEETASALHTSDHRVKKTEKLLRRRFFDCMRTRGYFDGYRLTRAGLEKLALFVLMAFEAHR